MSDLDEMDYHMSEDSRSEGDDEEDLEKLYCEAKAEFKPDAQPHRFEDLFSQESALQRKTTWGFKAAKRLLKNAVEQSDLDAVNSHYRRVLSYENAVTTYDIEKCVLRIVNRLGSPSQTAVLHALFSASIAEVPLTNASARAAVKLAQPLVRLEPNERTLCYLTGFPNRLHGTSAASKTTKNRCLLELYVLEVELLWLMGKLENMDVTYSRALSMEDVAIGLQHISSVHGYYGRYLLRSEGPVEAVVYFVKAVEGGEATSVTDEHHTACVQSLALVAYTSADTGADQLLHKYSGRPDIAAIRRFAMAFLREDVDGLEQVLAENDGTFEGREVRRLLRHYETVLKRKLCLKTSPLPSDCWSDILECLTHPIWHDLQSLCRKFNPVLALLLQHLHGDVQKARFVQTLVMTHTGPARHWEVTFYSKSGRGDKVVRYDGILGDAALSSAVMQGVSIVEIEDLNEATDEGVVRFCFGRDGRRLDIRQPMVTHCLFARLAMEHLSAANDQEFTLTVTSPNGSQSDVRRQTTTAFLQYRADTGTYEIPSGTAVLAVNLAFSLGGLDTMTVIRQRLTL